MPHCDSPERARQIAAACRHRGGSRGFATTTRAGSYGGAPREQHIAEQDATVTCIAMIEDQAALAHLEEIAAVKGIDAFFIGHVAPTTIGQQPRDAIAISSPGGDVDLAVTPGLNPQTGSASIVANSVRRVVAAEPGWTTVGQLPPAVPV